MSPVGHASHSPGSVKSENGVAMPQDSPSCAGGGYGGAVKRELTPPPPPPPSSSSVPPPNLSSQQQPSQGNPQDLNRMISMYLPGGGDAAAAAAAAASDQRLHSMYAGHYQAMVQGASSLGGGSPGGVGVGAPGLQPDGHPHIGPPPPTASMAHM